MISWLSFTEICPTKLGTVPNRITVTAVTVIKSYHNIHKLSWISNIIWLTDISSAAKFKKYCKRLHIDMYTKRKRLHAKYSIVHIVYLPFDNVWCLTAMGEKKRAIIGLFSEYFHFLSKQVILRLIKLIRNTLVLFYYMSKSLGYQLVCLNLTSSQKNLWSPFNMSRETGNDFPRIKNSVCAVEMLTNNHLITLPALTVNYRHLHYAIGAVNLFSVSEKLYLPFIFVIWCESDMLNVE